MISTGTSESSFRATDYVPQLFTCWASLTVTDELSLKCKIKANQKQTVVWKWDFTFQCVIAKTIKNWIGFNNRIKFEHSLSVAIRLGQRCISLPPLSRIYIHKPEGGCYIIHKFIQLSHEIYSKWENDASRQYILTCSKLHRSASAPVKTKCHICYRLAQRGAASFVWGWVGREGRGTHLQLSHFMWH